jgi:hypothetical protein
MILCDINNKQTNKQKQKQEKKQNITKHHNTNKTISGISIIVVYYIQWNIIE